MLLTRSVTTAVRAAARSAVTRAATVLGLGGESARAAGEQPTIVPRSEWGGDDQCAPRDAPSTGQVQFAMVHHTGIVTILSLTPT